MANNRELTLGMWYIHFMYISMQFKIMPYYALILMCFSYFKQITTGPWGIYLLTFLCLNFLLVR